MNPLPLQMFGLPVAAEKPVLADAGDFGDFAAEIVKADTADPALPDPWMLVAPSLILPVPEPQHPLVVGPESRPTPEPLIARVSARPVVPKVAEIASAAVILAPSALDVPPQGPPLQQQAPDPRSAPMMVPKPALPDELPQPEAPKAASQPPLALVVAPRPEGTVEPERPSILTPDPTVPQQDFGAVGSEFAKNSSNLAELSPHLPENRAPALAIVEPSGHSIPTTPGASRVERRVQDASASAQAVGAFPKPPPEPSRPLRLSPADFAAPATMGSPPPLPETIMPVLVRTHLAPPVAQARHSALPPQPIDDELAQSPSSPIASVISGASSAEITPFRPVIAAAVAPQPLAILVPMPEKLAAAQHPQIALRAPTTLSAQAAMIDDTVLSAPSPGDLAIPARPATTSSAESAWQLRLLLSPQSTPLRQPDLTVLHDRRAGAGFAAAPVDPPPTPAQSAAAPPDMQPETGPTADIMPEFSADLGGAETMTHKDGLAILSPPPVGLPEVAVHPPQRDAVLPAVMPAKVAVQIVPHAQRAKTGEVEVLLHPEELGSVKFQIQSQGETVRVVLSVERPETLDFLRRHAEHLVQEFRQAGFSGATLSFGSWGQQGGQPDAPPPPDLPADDPGFVPPAASRLAMQTGVAEPGQGLNLRL